MSPHHEKAGAPRLERPGVSAGIWAGISFSSSCYMSSHTPWAKATGSAGRMPSTSRAWS